jgi:hypothetical protein
MGVQLRTVPSMRSAQIAMSPNNRRSAGSGVFCWVRPEAVSRGPTGQASHFREVESLETSWVISLELAVGRGTHRRSSHTVIPGGGVGGGGAPHCYKSLCSNTELVVRQSLASKDMNTEAKEATALEAVTRWQWVKTQQTGKTKRML